MSTLLEDNEQFQQKFGFDEKKLTKEQLKFRMSLLEEEYEEALSAMREGNAEEWVDAHIDLMVIALGNLHLAGVNIQEAWNQVFKANMSKIRGVKKGRETSGGFDVMKPIGWKAPNHSDNHGDLDELFAQD